MPGSTNRSRVSYSLHDFEVNLDNLRSILLLTLMVRVKGRGQEQLIEMNPAALPTSDESKGSTNRFKQRLTSECHGTACHCLILSHVSLPWTAFAQGSPLWLFPSTYYDPDFSNIYRSPRLPIPEMPQISGTSKSAVQFCYLTSCFSI